jgi:hypothetical protein
MVRLERCWRTFKVGGSDREKDYLRRVREWFDKYLR